MPRPPSTAYVRTILAGLGEAFAWDPAARVDYLLRAPGAIALEGRTDDGASIVVSEWEDMAALRAFWDSEDYARIRALREGIARCEVMAVETPPAS